MDVCMIYHCPFYIDNRPFGNHIRPRKMLDAFNNSGFEVEAITGNKSERYERFTEIKKKIKDGKRYDFFYSESSTNPTIMADNYKKASFLDHNIIKFFKKNKVPTSLFYRDIHWRFINSYYVAKEPLKNGVFFGKSIIKKPLHLFDCYYYKKYIDFLFLPSVPMSKYLPIDWPINKLDSLPPGCDIVNGMDLKPNEGLPLKIFYVGGIKPPIYDLKNLFLLVKSIKNVSLTVCSRADGWKEYSSYYEYNTNNKNIEVVHAQGNELSKYFSEADVFIIKPGDHPYWSFASPLKLFESFGHCLPVITTKETEEVARIVKEDDAGWVVSSDNEMVELLKHLSANKQLIEEKKNHIKSIRNKHTWLARAEKVADIMLK